MEKVKHKLTKIFGGEYYEKETDTTHFYRGEINLFIRIKLFELEKFITITKSNIKIFYLKLFNNEKTTDTNDNQHNHKL